MNDPNSPVNPPRRRRRRTLSHITPNQRPQTYSPRAFQTRLDLCRVYDLMNQGKRPSEIAVMMRKDPAWVSRAIKKVQADFAIIFHKPLESTFTKQYLAKLEMLSTKAAAAIEESEGRDKLAAIKTQMGIEKEKMQFLQYIGLVPKDSEQPRPAEPVEREVSAGALPKAKLVKKDGEVRAMFFNC